MSRETAADVVEFVLQCCVPNTYAVTCATDADREALLAAVARRAEAAGHHMMTIAPPHDDAAGWRLNRAIRQEAASRHVLLVIDQADEVLPREGEPGNEPLFYWDYQDTYPVLLLMVGGEGLPRAMATADMNRHCVMLSEAGP